MNARKTINDIAKRYFAKIGKTQGYTQEDNAIIAVATMEEILVSEGVVEGLEPNVKQALGAALYILSNASALGQSFESDAVGILEKRSGGGRGGKVIDASKFLPL